MRLAMHSAHCDVESPPPADGVFPVEEHVSPFPVLKNLLEVVRISKIHSKV